jgi:hypothetical protein
MTQRRVLFIGGWGRSGSTLLDRVLGQVPGMFSAGEIREIWERGCLQNRPCGCDRPFEDCEVWHEVGEVAFGGWKTLDLDDVLALRFSVDRPWTVPAIASPWAPEAFAARRDRYVELLDALYRGIFDVTGAEVLVDSSKIPSHAYLLRRIGWIDLRVLHLVRDSRGAAYSWQKVVEKRVTDGDPSYLPRYGPIGTSARWLGYNAQTAALARFGVAYRRLRYEDLVREPERWTGRILGFAGHPVAADDLPFTGPGQVRLAPNHTVDGNPIRFSVGPTTVRADDAWRTGLSGRDRAIVTLATLPGLLRYGYAPMDGRSRG